MKYKSIILTLIFSLLIISGNLAGCAEKDPYADINKEYLYGIDEPVCEIRSRSGPDITFTVQDFDLDITADLIGALGAKSFRFRIPDSLMSTPDAYDEVIYNHMKEAEEKITAAGVELLIGVITIFPEYTGFRKDSARSVPHLDDPNYKEWMEAVCDMAEAVCKLFPDITHWEMGNESNGANFFHPNGYQKVEGSIDEQPGGFDREDLVKINADYMYYCSKGIKKANNNNVAITPGFSPSQKSFFSIQFFVEDLYEQIASGEIPTCSPTKSTNKRDYFDALCWHPYYDKIDDDWLEKNTAIYQVAIDNGDEGIKVYFTEFGFSDMGFQDRQDVQMEYTRKAFEYMENDMPYVEACMSFRLYQCEFATSWGGGRQNYFGFFTEPLGENSGFVPRPKAYILQEIYGGTGDLEKYANILG
jgi:hypothetical protein